MERVSFFCLLCCSRKELEIIYRMPQSFQNNNQIMEVEANNFTACNLAQKLVCLEYIEGAKFVVVYASAESATDI